MFQETETEKFSQPDNGTCTQINKEAYSSNQQYHPCLLYTLDVYKRQPLNEEQREFLANHFTLQNYKKNEIIHCEGETPTCLNGLVRSITSGRRLARAGHRYPGSVSYTHLTDPRRGRGGEERDLSADQPV